ncbi:MAG: 2-hydroxyacyl-CoA dehydratase [Peptococcaceae bacterium]|nr:2-hydroxyacyl-CoA dehydratase [Peptococcaceae bacterium]MBO5139802.1 2-hydroxyacyl-CoA dehydratase [Peptococcaceae bacterium]MBO5366444.1 2-hydroxyacyl-CoA dehydratase [Peptococcaceae bacterium]
MAKLEYDEHGRLLFTKEMKEEYTLLVPMMLPIHFSMLKSIFEREGYKMEILETQNSNIIQMGLKYCHNDICYPAQLTIGQLMDALQSGKYDINKVAVVLTQTGGGCRASNYISLLRKALDRAGLSHVPAVSMNFSGLEKNPGFELTPKMMYEMINAVIYGDLLMALHNQTLPYEKEPGASMKLVNHFVDMLNKDFANGESMGPKAIRKKMDEIVAAFAKVPVHAKNKVRVGIVGEIYVKFAPLGNNNLEEFLLKENAEPVVPGLLDFILYTADTAWEDYKRYGGKLLRPVVTTAVMQIMIGIQKDMIKAMEKPGCFHAPSTFKRTKELAGQVIDHGVKMGEGWLLTGEMMALIDEGVNNIVCTQPFGCLPNHVCGRGMMRRIKSIHPDANIVAIDYDAGATKVNQENRLKLMLATAKKLAIQK